MPDVTRLGYPFPVGTDRVMDGDDAIKALATAVDTKLGAAASGSATVPITAGATVASISVTFPAGRFTAAPAVLTTVNTGAQPDTFHSNAAGITATGCTIYGIRVNGASPFPVAWLAIQQ
jgi:hypothetical protein